MISQNRLVEQNAPARGFDWFNRRKAVDGGAEQGEGLFGFGAICIAFRISSASKPQAAMSAPDGKAAISI